MGCIVLSLCSRQMVLSTPFELYDMHAATDLLQSVGEDPVKVATETMLARGVLSKVVRDASKSRPGRTLKISDRCVGKLLDMGTLNV